MKQKYQQGDVLLVAVSKPLESNIKTECKIEKGGDKEGKVILALGEATGHHHRFELNKLDPGVTVSTVHERYGGYGGSGYRRDASYYLIEGGPATLYHEEHNPLTVPPGLYRRTIIREYDHISQSSREVWD
ncbi:MAG TPA: hypothetical protein EYO45_02650 [Candidatus Marinimicrobia bacterium]|nr:hypothetical protein [Candidatus Neomarinimicrobiota bacterium]